jgi:hypothetical protein
MFGNIVDMSNSQIRKYVQRCYFIAIDILILNLNFNQKLNDF